VIEPQTRTVSADTEPRTCAASPIVIVRLCTSPSTVPSTWMSPLHSRSPVILRSALMIDGAELLPAGRDGSGDGTAVGAMAEVEDD